MASTRTSAILAIVLVADFNYDLPDELIAQQPSVDRSGSRMMVVHRKSGAIHDRSFRDLPDFLGSGDCLIANRSKVLASRLYGRRRAGNAQIEVFLTRELDASTNVWQALVRPGRKVPVGERITFSESLQADVIGRGDHGVRTLQFESTCNVHEELNRVGHIPLPPYIQRPDTSDDAARYQTVFAQDPGSVAAPTAGLHFTPEVVESAKSKGARLAFVTLHVGLGTFAPLRAERLDEIRLHEERFSIDAESFAAIQESERKIAIGTTSVRALESSAAQGALEGETSLFISPGHRFQLVDAMLTNFHLPKSSLLILVSAFAGIDLVREAYERAVRERYRFFSYGDCMLILE